MKAKSDHEVRSLHASQLFERAPDAMVIVDEKG